MTEGFVVYWLYAKNGRLQYIGQTGALSARLRKHRLNWKAQGREIGPVRVMRCASRSEATKLERRSIFLEQPPLNENLRMFYIMHYKTCLGLDYDTTSKAEREDAFKRWVMSNRAESRRQTEIFRRPHLTLATTEDSDD